MAHLGFQRFLKWQRDDGYRGLALAVCHWCATSATGSRINVASKWGERVPQRSNVPTALEQ
eukprot:1550678-Pyramimonas_sp.AAC.1